MASIKRALLIASPWGDLQGTFTDADRMRSVLIAYGFHITECRGPQATRSGIITAWKNLVLSSAPDDVVVVYYSGHGGIVESPAAVDNGYRAWRYQFLVPVDFEDTRGADFKGILDIEISSLLHSVTEKTHNVTTILDCCYSGRLVRAPGLGDTSRARRVPMVLYDDVTAFINRYGELAVPENQTVAEDNPYAVRLAAAAASEIAWEVRGSDGLWMGSFTFALAQVLQESQSLRQSWRTSILRVRELVQAQFPSQHPQVEGPHTRIPFSLTEVGSDAIHLKIEAGQPVLQAGRVAHVSGGDVYAVKCLQSERPSTQTQIAVCEIISVQAFQALGRLDYTVDAPRQEIPLEGALAFLQQSARYRWPISVPPSLLGLLCDKVQQSQFIRLPGENEPGAVLLSLFHRDNFVGIKSQSGIDLTTRYMNPESSKQLDYACQAVVVDADRLACAPNILTVRNETDEWFRHRVDVKVGLVEDHQPETTFAGAGCDQLYEGQRIYIKLQNDSTSTTAYVNILHINVQGKISLISMSCSEGIELPPGRSHWIRKTKWGVLEGLQISWPADVPRDRPVDEHLLFFVTNLPVDLRPLTSLHYTPQRTAHSRLVRRLYQLCCGGQRELIDNDESNQTVYDIIHFPLTVIAHEDSQAMRATRLRGLLDSSYNDSHSPHKPIFPSMFSETQDLPDLPPHLNPETRGLVGQALRSIQGIPACVWVVNEHTEAITVVVSQYRPSRLWTDAGLNASTTGVGFDLSTTTFTPPATRKTLAPAAPAPKRSMATFPLWTRRDGFGVITVFVGSTQTLYIENDRIPIGATAYFRNEPDLHIKEYGSD
ncbi:uncharacterized protein BO87DRAFT_461838 [Aspergillus neoniger CBS 115656]|uniref:Peptidase C14 caspase domain-containing protein n=1 Tax=Aspergillus neoniger (strain CBS 115656) TaxID=1448310 RepID=A0A318Y9I7_ASPNB|nr:hypothetical protein BO87DRAFT_461838 [Aspergillus neoniger CBS 115656]PYH30985.1 hypothetical protein BO87DRAFT_461838 [Aspergillus neoniger CBS 115656]